MTFSFHSNEECDEDEAPELLSDSDSDDDDAMGGRSGKCMVSAAAMLIQQGRIVPHYLSSSSDSEGEIQSEPGKEWRLQLPPHPNDSICNPRSPKGRWHLRKMTGVEAIVRGLETSTQLIHWWTRIGRRRNRLQACKDALVAGRRFDTKEYEAEIERPRRLVRTVKIRELEAFEEDEEVMKQQEALQQKALDISSMQTKKKSGPYIQAEYMATREGEPYESGQVFDTTVEEAVTALSTKSVSYRVVKGVHEGVPGMIPKAPHSDEENERWMGIRQAIGRMVALQLGFMISKMAFLQHHMEPEMHWQREATTTGNRDSANNEGKTQWMEMRKARR